MTVSEMATVCQSWGCLATSLHLWHTCTERGRKRGREDERRVNQPGMRCKALRWWARRRLAVVPEYSRPLCELTEKTTEWNNLVKPCYTSPSTIMHRKCSSHRVCTHSGQLYVFLGFPQQLWRCLQFDCPLKILPQWLRIYLQPDRDLTVIWWESGWPDPASISLTLLSSSRMYDVSLCQAFSTSLPPWIILDTTNIFFLP